MTIKELIKELKRFDENINIAITVPYSNEEYTDKDFNCDDFWIYDWGGDWIELTTTKELSQGG
jgi:hypothetical protein